MVQTFEGETANDVWWMAASNIRELPTAGGQQGRGGTTKEILHAIFTIRSPRQRWVTTRLPPINPAFAVAEIVWIVNGRNDSAYLNYWNPQLPKYAGSGEHYHGAYGFRLRHSFGIDQLRRTYLALKHNPNGRQVVLQIWDPAGDLPNEDGSPVDTDIPCNIVALLKVRQGKLEWLQVMRSNDLFRGTPYNFIQFTSLQEVMAGWLEIDLGSYNHISDSLHVYERDLQAIYADKVSSTAQNIDSLALPKEVSDAVFAKLEQCISEMTNQNLSNSELTTIVRRSKLSLPYSNLLRITAAEAARKRGWLEDSQKFMSSCTNPMLIEAWDRWLDRFISDQHASTRRDVS